ncbi:drug resistance transporter, EmrB/QacA subfamily [Sporobacter termitidis DSM 10068]|uniref:Drug resistance transporter, EmrB/QacA subfamily n=1 Tax=Sporobacter termitidis DSM 10068 TaxID=1123282 RepID=A0A1M5YJN5_9FIRM|nr:MFS transporter [Sporobacter termitidis]SHI12225.1 drug resistance transporter, EmrB/QacA subfamily [Sporobacter termitidis DSM 10068]
MNTEITNARKWTIIVITSLSAFMATLDGSIVNIGLPMMSSELHVSIESIQWVVTAYLLTISLMLLIWGKLSDVYGKKYIFASGFLIFSLGSALCSFSHSLPFIVVSRIIQALGAAAMMSLSQAIVTGTFPPTERGRALGVLATMVALGSLVGPSLGGILVSAFGWPSIFLINIPIGVAGFILAIVIIPEIFEKQKSQRFDVAGTGLFCFSMLLLFLGLLFAQEGAFPVIWLIPIVLVSLAGLWLFIRVERKKENPLLNIGLFRLREFSFGLVAAYLTYIALNSTMLFIPFYLQDLLKFDPLKAGLIVSAYPIAMAIVAPVSGWLSDRITYRPLTVVGLAVTTAALVLLATINETTSIVKIILLMVMLGGGFAVFQSPNNSSVMGCVPRAQLGIAGGANALFRNLGMVSGTTFSVLIFSFVSKLNINNLTGGFNAQSFVRGLSVIFIFCAVCTFAAMLVSLTRAVRTRGAGERNT